jgi:16S rRNA (cytidine1402-2'-O)-methyltransferase
LFESIFETVQHATMISDLSAQATQLAVRATADQSWPEAALYVVATPIGNSADITLRALAALSHAHTVACEDTRHTAPMLRLYGLDKPLVPLHQHNEREATEHVLAKLRAGERVAYVSDAGTPAVSDPGAKLARTVADAGFRVLPMPGASSVAAALSAAGAASDSGFVFWGFVDKPAGFVQRVQSEVALLERPVVLFEAPHRIAKLATALAELGARPITICREITKQFEQIHTLACRELAAWLAQDSNRERGEFVLVLHAAPANTEDASNVKTQDMLQALLPHMPLKTAVDTTVKLLGGQRKVVYDMALSLKASSESED